jgi:hypothetical protein
MKRAAVLALLAALATPLWAIINCYDYVHYRVTNGEDPNPVGVPNRSGTGEPTLQARLRQLGYRLAVQASVNDRPKIYPEDVVFIDGHTGYVRSDGLIDHYIQVYGGSGNPVDYTHLVPHSVMEQRPNPRDRFGGLFQGHDLGQFIGVESQPVPNGRLWIFRKETALTIEVFSTAGNAPVSGASVRLMSMSGTALPRGDAKSTGADGTVTFSQVPALKMEDIEKSTGYNGVRAAATHASYEAGETSITFDTLKARGEWKATLFLKPKPATTSSTSGPAGDPFAAIRKRLKEIEDQIAVGEGNKVKADQAVANANTEVAKIKTAKSQYDVEEAALKAFEPDLIAIGNFCTAATAKARTMQTRAQEASTAGETIGTLLVEASRFTDCAQANSAVEIETRFKQAIQQLSRAAVARNQVRTSNQELTTDAADLIQKLAKVAGARPAVDRAKAQQAAADAALKEALKFDAQDSGLRPVVNTAGTRALVDLARVKSFAPTLPPDLDTRIGTLEARATALTGRGPASQTATGSTTYNTLKSSADALKAKFEGHLTKVCTNIDPLDGTLSDANATIDAIQVLFERRGDLMEKAAACRTCGSAVQEARQAMADGNFDRVRTLMTQPATTKCDFGDLAGSLAALQALSQQLNSLSSQCSFPEAQRAAEDFDRRFPGNPWVERQIGKMKMWVGVQNDIENDLLLAANAPDKSPEARKFIKAAQDLAAGVQCLSDRVDRFVRQYDAPSPNAEWLRFMNAANEAMLRCDFRAAKNYLAQADRLPRPRTVLSGPITEDIDRALRRNLNEWAATQDYLDQMAEQATRGVTEQDKVNIRAIYERQKRAVGSCPLTMDPRLRALLAGDSEPTDDVPDSLRGSKTRRDPGYMDGACSGSIVGEPASGYVGDISSAVIAITRSPRPIAKVMTDNPACRNCEAVMEAPGRFRYTGRFTAPASSPLPFTFVFAFAAYDAAGNKLCSGASGQIGIVGRH